ncbi:hypothetical protein LOZ53_002123 [Ophidiomyces ophidiicola]|nr:hypothetical protein LOZ55_003758 [Ophidiomyces ophidiicola]KAI1989538.1 hypothetical protein LOZ54_002838 [Ophidiomyces ophidiicola]KAI1993355.1 hypothetical protein LOZ53_002123 [Ophidiomyces ophidiicola]KAI1995651.1 hypothetical protein LOZ51_003477 [Ophidiomyces ophidiicola]
MNEEWKAYHPSNLLHTQEWIARYKPGGYHPVSLGDCLNDSRYTIYHKLGWGGYSTVWLARDNRLRRWVSIKIITADSSQKSKELENLEILAKKSQSGLLKNYIVEVFDHFFHKGPNGNHLCIVFELLGPTISTVLQDYSDGGDRLDEDTILKLTKQLLIALAFIHKSGLVHGDISGRNIAFSCNRLSQLSEKDLFEVLGAPRVEDLVRIDGAPLADGMPHQMVEAAKWDDWIDEDDEDLRILDFGEAFHQGSAPSKLSQPGNLQVPESIMTDHLDYRLDLWRAGLMIYSFVFTSIPFFYLGDNTALIMRMVQFVGGELPNEWRDKWERLVAERAQDSLAQNGHQSESELDMRFDGVHEPALKGLSETVKSLLRLNPSDRVSAQDALDLLPTNTT